MDKPIYEPPPEREFIRNPQSFPSDGQRIWVDRKRFKIERDPASTEDVEIIKFSRIQEQG